MQQIIQLGAKRIVVPGNFPLGCIPVALNFVSNASSLEFDEFGCSRSFNDLARYQNSYLQTALNSLRKEFPDAVIVYADFYGSFRSVLTRASFLGETPHWHCSSLILVRSFLHSSEFLLILVILGGSKHASLEIARQE